MSEDNKIQLGGNRPNPNQSTITNAQGGNPLEFEFNVPTDVVELPSRGYFYNGKSTVQIKYLTAEEDDILFSPELIKSGRQLDVLIQNAVLDKDIPSNKLLSGDRNYILIALRRTGLGDEYVFGTKTCPECSHQYEPVVDLSQLKPKYLDEKPNEMGEYSLVLPFSKVNIKFRFLTGEDEQRLSKIAEQSSKKGSGVRVNKLLTERYLSQIMEVNGNRDKLKIRDFISKMPMRDSAFFRDFIKRVEPGIDLNYDFECPSCGHVHNTDVPITIKLFYPEANA